MNKSDYTPEQWQAARHAAASKELACAAVALDKGYFADHISVAYACSYQRKQIQEALDIIEGKNDANFTIRQRMEYYLTGQSTPLLG